MTTKLQKALDAMTDPPRATPIDKGCAVCGEPFGPHPTAGLSIVAEGQHFPCHIECEPEWSRRGR
jgi:hypothetical protein